MSTRPTAALPRDLRTHAPGGDDVAAPAELRAPDALTIDTASAFCRAFRRSVTAGGTQVRVNLEAVERIDVVGLAALLQARRLADSLLVKVSIRPSPAVRRTLLEAGLLDEVRLEGGPHRALARPPAAPAPPRPAPPGPLVAHTARLGVRPPVGAELPLFERWAHDPLLDQMVGSELLYVCRHVGARHPDFVARVLDDPTALTLLVLPVDPAADPVGFVRLHNIHLAEGFAFLETAVLPTRPLRTGWGVEASRLVLAWAMDTLGLRRVESKVYAYNVLSINSLKRNGFRKEGVLREARTYDGRRWDILVFGIVEQEMREQRAQEQFPDMGLWQDGRDDDP